MTLKTEQHSPQPLIDGRQITLKLMENSTGRLGTIVVRGEFARADEATANGRIYPLSLWQTQIARLNESMAARKVLGELDHPDDGRTLLQRVSHLVTNLTLDPSGIVIGEAIILDTQRGRDLKAMLNAGCQIGVSSRGFGTTRPHPTLEGKEVVSEDYQLDTFDFVAQPADQHAFPKVFGESFTREHPEYEYRGLDMINKQSQAKGEAAPAPRSPSVDEVLNIASDVRSKVEEQVRADLLRDPKNLGAKNTLEEVGKILTPYFLPESVRTLVEEKDQEIERLKKMVEERDRTIEESAPKIEIIENRLRVTSYKLYLEQKTRNLSTADAVEIKKAVGPVDQYESSKDLIAKVDLVQKAIADRHAVALRERQERERQERAIEEARQMERRSFQEREEALKREKAKLTEAANKLLSVVETQGLQLYIKQRLETHPQRFKLGKIIESSLPNSREAVDSIIEANTSRSNDSEAAAAARANVRRFHGGGGRSIPSAYEETGGQRRAPVEESFDELPIDMSSFDRMVGLR